MAANTIVIDNGGGSLKAGMAGEDHPSVVVPNCTAKIKNQLQTLVAEETDEAVRNSSQLLYIRPCDRGYLVNWPCESEVWTRVFGKKFLNVANPSEHQLLVSVPPFNPPILQDDMTEVVFEEFGFSGLAQVPALKLAAYDYENNSGFARPCLVVDSGFSFSHAGPVVAGPRCAGQVCRAAVRRVNVGGKLLTNYLKEMISYRQWNMMDDFRLVNEVKEKLCYVPRDFDAELAAALGPPATNGVAKEFVLPDYQTTVKGFVRDPRPPQPGQMETEQVLRMAGERAAVGEAPFRPPDLGLDQAGLPEAAAAAVRAAPPAYQGLLTSNIVLTGGNTLLPGFSERFLQDLRPHIDHRFEINLRIPQDPITHTWKAAAAYAAGPAFAGVAVTRQEYEEHGHALCRRRWEAAW